MIRVVIVEDQTLVRQGLRSLLALAGDIEIVGEAADGEEAVRLIPELRPDVVLLDLRMPKLSGVEVLRQLDASNQLPATLVLTTFDDDTLLLEAVRNGARGYLLKDVSLERLTESIRRIAEGKTDLQPVITERILQSLTGDAPSRERVELPDPLTERENQVLRLIAFGLSNREIAELLHLSEGTVKNHTSNMLSKLGVRDRTRAVLKAIDLGILR
jgi:DNA-binding NarL/FixJ family response regulator